MESWRLSDTGKFKYCSNLLCTLSMAQQTVGGILPNTVVVVIPAKDAIRQYRGFIVYLENGTNYLIVNQLSSYHTRLTSAPGTMRLLEWFAVVALQESVYTCLFLMPHFLRHCSTLKMAPWGMAFLTLSISSPAIL